MAMRHTLDTNREDQVLVHYIEVSFVCGVKEWLDEFDGSLLQHHRRLSTLRR